MTRLFLTQNYLLCVSFEKIEYGDPYVDPCDLLDPITIYLEHYENNKMFNSYCRKIIAHRPLNGAPEIPSIRLLPELKLDKTDTFPNNFDGKDYIYFIN